MQKFTLAAVGAVAAIAFAAPTFADSIPSSKAVYKLGNIQLMTEAAIAAVEDGNNLVDSDSDEQAVLTSLIKTANGSDLVMDLSAVCKLWNDTTASSKGGKKESSSSSNQLKLSIIVETLDNQGNLIDEPVVEPAEVTYCQQDTELSATFQGIFQDLDGPTEDGFVVTTDAGADDNIENIVFPDLETCQAAGDADGTTVSNTCALVENLVGTCLFITSDNRIVLDESCLTPEEVALMLHTVEANAFVFAAVDVVAGIQRITVTADIESEAEVETEAADGFSSDSSTQASARALLGHMALDVEERRFVKDLDVTCDNTSSNPIEWCSAVDDDDDDIHDFVDPCPGDNTNTCND